MVNAATNADCLYTVIDAPTDGTTGQHVGDFRFRDLPVRLQDAIHADPDADSWTLPALSEGDSGDELDDLRTIVTRDVP